MDQHTEAPATLSEQVAGEVRAALGRRRISGAQLARQLGWAQSYMARRIDGRVPFDLDDLGRIAEALDVTLADLLPQAALQRRARPAGGQTMGPSFAQANQRRRRSARRRRATVRPTRREGRPDDGRPNGHPNGSSTTPVTRRPVLIPRPSNR